MSKFFVRIGLTLWIIGAGGAALVLLLHYLGELDASLVDWRQVAIKFGVGGLASFLVAAVCKVWEKWDY